MPLRSFMIPVSNGIFEHKRRIGPAIWEFLWLIDHITHESAGPTGTLRGSVLGGSPLAAQRVAADLNESVDSARQHLSRLESEGYIERQQNGTGDAYCYVVLNSKKWVWWKRKSATASPGGQARQISTSLSEENPMGIADLPSANKETIQNNTEQYLSSFAPDSHAEAEFALRRVWEYYLQQLDRNPKLYTFTPTRRKKGLLRLRECMSKVGGDMHRAVELMKIAIDNLAESDWHTGRDPRTNGHRYIEWEDHLFRNSEQLEKWLAR